MERAHETRDASDEIGAAAVVAAAFDAAAAVERSETHGDYVATSGRANIVMTERHRQSLGCELLSPWASSSSSSAGAATKTPRRRAGGRSFCAAEVASVGALCVQQNRVDTPRPTPRGARIAGKSAPWQRGRGER
jgi:hypothetical protein